MAHPATHPLDPARAVARQERKAARREVQHKAHPAQNGRAFSDAVRTEAKIAYCSGRYSGLPELAEELGISVNTIKRWAKQEKWKELKNNHALQVDRRLNLSLEDHLLEMKRRHLDAALALQSKGYEALVFVPVQDVNDAVKLIESGVKMERTAVGADHASKDALNDLLSGEVIAAAIEKQRVILVRKEKT